MKLPCQIAAAWCAVGCLTLGACHSGRETEAKTVQVEEKAPLAKATPDEFGTYEQCVSYPVPKDFHWPRETLEAFCADEFTPDLKRSEIRKMIDAGEGKKLDARFDGIVREYFSGKLPEGTARYAYQKFDNAEDATGEMIERWLAQSPDSAHALAARGTHRVARGTEARGTALSRDTPPENFQRMDHELRLAKQDLEKALETNAKILRAYEAIIDAARLDGDRDLGAWALAGALRVDPKNFYIRATYQGMQTPRWGGSFEALDEIAADAQRWFDKNPRVASLRAYSISHRGYEDYAHRRYELALSAYERGLVGAPVSFDLYLAGLMADKLKRHERAVELFSQRLRFKPFDENARYYRASNNIDLKRYDAARADLEVSLENNPQDIYALRAYARMLIIQKDYKGALPKLELAHQVDPADTWAVKELASIYLYTTRSFKQAEPLVTQLLENDPKNGAAWLLRADVIQNLKGSGLREAAENFVRYADSSDEVQAKALPKVKAWLARQPPS